MNTIKHYKHPITFYFLSTFITWAFWFIAAYLSHNPDNATLTGIFMMIGLVSPTVIAYVMMQLNKYLRHDFFSRIFSFPRVKPFYILLTFFLMPASILAAQAISLLFGHSAEQFTFASQASFTFSLFPAWIILFLAPAIEELAWHSYGTDCLRARFNLFITCIIFTIFWVLWHFPLSFIEGYYHSNIAETSWLYSLNFAVSLFPFVFLMNWLYYKTNRNILVAVIFHITAGVFNELFLTHPDSKVIQTVLLLILSVFLIFKDKELFFKKDYSSL